MSGEPVPPARPRTVLVVEDNPDHAMLMRIALGRAAPQLEVKVVGDGLEAIAYLEGKGPHADRTVSPYPDLVMLDLIMPGLDGFGVLAWIRGQEGTNGLPVVVLTSSINPQDEARARRLGASDFQTKPSDLTRLGEQVRDLVARWVD